LGGAAIGRAAAAGGGLGGIGGGGGGLGGMGRNCAEFGAGFGGVASSSQFPAPDPAKSKAVGDLTSALEARGFGALGGFGGVGPMGGPRADEPAPAAAASKASGQPSAGQGLDLDALWDAPWERP
jgi:hypothetical protein